MFKQASSMARHRTDRTMRRLIESEERRPYRKFWLGLRAMVKASDGPDHAYCPARIWGNHPDKQVRAIARAQAHEQHAMREAMGLRRACPRPSQDTELRVAVYNNGFDTQLAKLAQGTIKTII